MDTRKRLTGFTLIELLIVVAIIAILAAIAVPNFLEAQTRARIARVKSDLRAVSTALEAYVVDERKYPEHAIGVGNRVHYVNYLRQITTPVAYMTSCELADPFFPKQWGASIFPEHTYLSYEYCCYLWRPETWWADKQPKNGYCLVSPGPDRWPQFINWGFAQGEIGGYPATWGPFAHWETIYDATNGTVSAGDLGRFGGMLPSPPQN